MDKRYYVYILTNRNNHVLYTGVTNNLARRIFEHKNGAGDTFTSKYNLHKLVYFEETNNVESAILREKQIKKGSRRKKLELIEGINPDWNDLMEVCSLSCNEIATPRNGRGS